MKKKCLKCGYEWDATKDNPARCPRCKTAAWMYPPGVGFGTHKEEHKEKAEEEGKDKTDLPKLRIRKKPHGKFRSVPKSKSGGGRKKKIIGTK